MIENMIKDIIKTERPEDQIINEIIEMEWVMFDKVMNIGGRAGCQDDLWTFYAQRYSQFAAYSMNILTMYRQDLAEAAAQGRNVITEKYGYMMEYTDPQYYNSTLASMLPPVTKTKEDLVMKIVAVLMQCEVEFAERYPAINDRNRPLSGSSASNTSFRVYTIGELKTYSIRTLKALLLGVESMVASGVNPSVLIHEATVKFYGYRDLDDAEAKLRNSR